MFFRYREHMHVIAKINFCSSTLFLALIESPEEAGTPGTDTSDDDVDMPGLDSHSRDDKSPPMWPLPRHVRSSRPPTGRS
jgi:hypothetical protein